MKLISRLDTTEERISELEGMITETSQSEKQREKKTPPPEKGKQIQGRISKNCGTIPKVVTYHNGNTRRKRQNQTEARFEGIMAENFPQINVRHEATDPGSSENVKPSKCQTL